MIPEIFICKLDKTNKITLKKNIFYVSTSFLNSSMDFNFKSTNLINYVKM